MPPKENITIAKGSNFTVEVNLKIDHQESCPLNFSELHIRIASGWIDCVTTENIFSSNGTWKILSFTINGEDNSNGSQIPPPIQTLEPGSSIVLSLEKTFELDLKSREKMEIFNNDPGIYVFIMDRTNPVSEEPNTSSLKTTPHGFNYIDCSSLQYKNSTISSRSQNIHGLLLSTKVSISEPLITPDQAISLCPFILNLKSLGDYPIQFSESQSDALNFLYIFGTIKFNKVSSRKLFARTMLLEEFSENFEADNPLKNLVKNKTGEYRDVPINLKSCILSGLEDYSQFKELLNSSTFSLKVFNENLCGRVFNQECVDTYNSMLSSKLASGAPAAANAPAGKGKPPAKGSAPTSSSPVLPPGPIDDSDLFLIKSFWSSVENGDKILPHGVVRFRLEQLLSTSADLLKEFEQKKNKETNENTVVVTDSIFGEIRLEKPIKPEKKSRPADISLRSALQRAIKEENNNNSDLSKTKSKEKPRHEKFIENGSNIRISVELYRNLKHPEEVPSVLSNRVLRQINNADDPFTLTTTSSGLAATLSHSLTLRSTFNTIKDSSQRIKRDLSNTETLPKNVEERISVTPYTRMVFVFKYNDDETLTSINNAVASVNRVALPDIQGSIRSYQLTKGEVDSANAGGLDVVCGFTVIDDDVRIVVIEGLAGPDKAMQEIYLDIPRLQPNNKSLKILCNPDVLFPSRLYTEYGPEIKRIRIRDKLNKLARSPEIYNRNQVEEVCFEAIDRVMALRMAIDLKSTKELNMYPTPQSLNTVELLYGEAISRIDLDGAEAEKLRLASLKKKNKQSKEHDNS